MKTKRFLRKNIVPVLFPMLFSGVAFELSASEVDGAEQTVQVHELHYLEREPGVDNYEVIMLVSERYIRVEQSGDNSGFILYDDKKKKIYSVSKHEESILVIDEHKFTGDSAPASFDLEYLELTDAPSVSGNKVFNYRIYTGKGTEEVTCMEAQLVENILPDVRIMLRNYQKVISGQHVKMADNQITDLQPACYYIDQIYNTGAYYEKGMPIQEWHSNDHSKMLMSFKAVTVNRDRFEVPENYKQFSIDNNSKTFIK